MPYVTCSCCGLTAFSAARWSSVEHCAACDAELPRRRRRDAGSTALPLVPTPHPLRSRSIGFKAGGRV